MRFTIDQAKHLGASRAETRQHRSAFVKVITSGSKPCPHCPKTISANKAMCLAGVTEFGTLRQWAATKQKELAAV